MVKDYQIQVLPEVAANQDGLREYLVRKFNLTAEGISHVEILRKSIDARKKPVKVSLTVRVFINQEYNPPQFDPPIWQNVSNKEEVLIVGAGPAGLFAALKCIQLGKKPVILERGKDVRARRRDIKALNIAHVVNEDSNYCFGEGGAGAYSDGKLYTRSKKRGDVRAILELLVAFGANHNILVDAHPHIGTNKLPGIIARIRKFILSSGGDIHFDTRITELLVNSAAVSGVITQSGDKLHVRKLILATGHSARDIYQMLQRQNIAIEVKPFALGVRVQHPQSLIDSIQYHCADRGSHLPPAAYNIVRQVEGRGVYSFCMCPGGIIAPCATAPGEVVTNGWSPSRRDQKTANSGIVVQLQVGDFLDYQKYGPLAGLEFQKAVEQKACVEAGGTQRVPAQRLMDFMKGKHSNDLPASSYIPGVSSAELSNIFPGFVHSALLRGFRLFGKSMRGYLTNEALVHAPESRTSAPVRIPRDADTLQHIQIGGLYPCGEGAGYAGGIISAAMDGMKCAQRCIESM
jgi:uncharacterized FAD-dependent dehydrogenase